MKYQVISYEQAYKLFPEMEFEKEYQDTTQEDSRNLELFDDFLLENILESPFPPPYSEPSTTEQIPRRPTNKPRDFTPEERAKYIPDIESFSDKDGEDEEDEGDIEIKNPPHKFKEHLTEFRNRYNHAIRIKIQEDQDFESMEEAESQDILPIKVKGDVIIVPNCIYKFIEDVNIVFVTHFHHEEEWAESYSKYYLITDHCEVLDLEILNRKTHFIITMTYISQKSYVIDFFQDDPSVFRSIRREDKNMDKNMDKKEFGSMKKAQESYLKYFCSVFEKQIYQFDEISKFSIENGIDMHTLTEELLPKTISHMNEMYMQEIYETLTQKDQEIEKLRKEVERLKTHIQYMPDGEMFLETQKHFDSCITSFK